jgi:hypothetical protein
MLIRPSTIDLAALLHSENVLIDFVPSDQKHSGATSSG